MSEYNGINKKLVEIMFPKYQSIFSEIMKSGTTEDKIALVETVCKRSVTDVYKHSINSIIFSVCILVAMIYFIFQSMFGIAFFFFVTFCFLAYNILISIYSQQEKNFLIRYILISKILHERTIVELSTEDKVENEFVLKWLEKSMIAATIVSDAVRKLEE